MNLIVSCVHVVLARRALANRCATARAAQRAASSCARCTTNRRQRYPQVERSKGVARQMAGSGAVRRAATACPRRLHARGQRGGRGARRCVAVRLQIEELRAFEESHRSPSSKKGGAAPLEPWDAAPCAVGAACRYRKPRAAGRAGAAGAPRRTGAAPPGGGRRAEGTNREADRPRAGGMGAGAAAGERRRAFGRPGAARKGAIHCVCATRSQKQMLGAATSVGKARSGCGQRVRRPGGARASTRGIRPQTAAVRSRAGGPAAHESASKPRVQGEREGRQGRDGRRAR
jgi:hypothetical protein